MLMLLEYDPYVYIRKRRNNGSPAYAYSFSDDYKNNRLNLNYVLKSYRTKLIFMDHGEKKKETN